MKKTLVIAVCIIAIIGVLFVLQKPDTPDGSTISDQGAERNSAPVSATKNTAAVIPPATTENSGEYAIENPTATEETSEISVQVSEPEPIMGSFLTMRTITSDKDGTTRNIEFIFRPGILPRKLFQNNNTIITNLDQLTRNTYGSGAKTILIYYEVISADTNLDGTLDHSDKVNVAVSYPDGSSFRTLASGVDKILQHEFLPVDHHLRLIVEKQGKKIQQIYSLNSYSLLSEEVI